MVTNWKRILQRILIVVVTCLLAYFIPNFNMVVSFNILVIHIIIVLLMHTWLLHHLDCFIHSSSSPPHENSS